MTLNVNSYARWRQWRELHRLRAHLSVLLLLKLIALVAIYHFFFLPTRQMPIDASRVAERVLQASPAKDDVQRK